MPFGPLLRIRMNEWINTHETNIKFRHNQRVNDQLSVNIQLIKSPCLVFRPPHCAAFAFESLWTSLPPPRRIRNRRCLSVCLLATLRKKLPNGSAWNFAGKVGNGPMNKWLNFGGYPDPYPYRDCTITVISTNQSVHLYIHSASSESSERRLGCYTKTHARNTLSYDHV